MEVHHHTHHPKKWKEYFWEFFMLFLAVFCGFLAEYQLEHVIEHQREKQYVRSLIEDLKNDQTILSKHIDTERKSILMLDTLTAILNNATSVQQNAGTLYYLARLAPRQMPLATNTRTFEQLKNSGNFRLIRRLEISNSIMSYYEKFPQLRMLESIHQQEQIEYQKAAAKIFSAEVFLKMEGENIEILRTTETPEIAITTAGLLKELAVYAVYIRGTKKGILASSLELKSTSEELVKYLEKEYHIE